MENWVISLLSAFGGAVAALIGRELIEWFKHPRLEIDFEERKGEKPYILDLLNDRITTIGVEERFKFLRLTLKNDGKSPAMNCEARIEISDKDDNEILKTTLHWARNDPAIYGEDKLDKIYAPIHLNPKDNEELDVFCLRYCKEKQYDENGKPFIGHRNEPNFYTMSFRRIPLERNTEYIIRTSVYANNAASKAFRFKVNWDGTLEGFNKAFS